MIPYIIFPYIIEFYLILSISYIHKSMNVQSNIRPFLKWPGRKFSIIGYLKNHFIKPNKEIIFIEPFLGSAAVFLNTDYKNYVLNDSNQDLINVYLYLMKEGEKFIKYCNKYFIEKNNVLEQYYDLRDIFNNSTVSRKKAALFVYLNRHGYNGLCRYNSSGQYNVPFGRYKTINLLHNEMLAFYNKANTNKIKIQCSDFTTCFEQVNNNTVFYCDPPYVPISSSASFTQYDKESFNFTHQKKLVDLVVHAKKLGAASFISNHDLTITRELYEGAKIVSFDVKRTISCKSNNRNYVKELLAIY
jgi:DNA adenine methylase